MLMRSSFYAVMLTTLVGGSAWAFADEAPKKEGGPRPEGRHAKYGESHGAKGANRAVRCRRDAKRGRARTTEQVLVKARAREGQGPRERGDNPEGRRPPEGNQPPRGEGFGGNPGQGKPGFDPQGPRPQGFGPGQPHGPEQPRRPDQPHGPGVNPQDLQRLQRIGSGYVSARQRRRRVGTEVV